MALTANESIELGTACPNFRLESVDSKTYTLSDFSKSKALLVAFICNHCPYVMKIEDQLLALARNNSIEDLQLIGICSNDPERYLEDSPANLLKRWREKNYGFPYLLDTTQMIAKDFNAVCTPDLFLYDSKRRLYYHGCIEGMQNAVDNLIVGTKPSKNQKASIGCSIKWF